MDCLKKTPHVGWRRGASKKWLKVVWEDWGLGKKCRHFCSILKMCHQVGMQLSSFRLLIPLGLKVALLIERIDKDVLMEGSQKVAKIGWCPS